MGRVNVGRGVLMLEEEVDESRGHEPGAGARDGFVRFLAWCVHFYTALGLVLAAAIAVLLVRGGPDSFRWSFVLMFVATFVDATDGTLARLVGVKRVLPRFDGRKLDDIVDFLTYTFLPLMLVSRQLLPAGQEGWLLLPLLASAYGFCQVEAKTDDGYFLGFPSLWNVVAFYLYLLHLPGWLALGILIVFGLLTFVPARYLYPTQPGPINAISSSLGAIWAGLLAWIFWRACEGLEPSVNVLTWRLTLISLYYPAFYLGASWIISLKRVFDLKREDSSS